MVRKREKKTLNFTIFDHMMVTICDNCDKCAQFQITIFCNFGRLPGFRRTDCKYKLNG